jgi:hypothetical protein
MLNEYILPPRIAEIIHNCVEIRLKSPNDFLKIKETLTRIGIASYKDRKLFQSCHILHKQGYYYLVHFKELFLLDGKVHQTVFDEGDKARRNTIANLLSDWGLLELVDPTRSAVPVSKMNLITIISFRDKEQWELCAKYEIGKKRV